MRAAPIWLTAYITFSAGAFVSFATWYTSTNIHCPLRFGLRFLSPNRSRKLTSAEEKSHRSWFSEKGWSWYDVIWYSRFLLITKCECRFTFNKCTVQFEHLKTSSLRLQNYQASTSSRERRKPSTWNYVPSLRCPLEEGGASLDQDLLYYQTVCSRTSCRTWKNVIWVHLRRLKLRLLILSIFWSGPQRM